MPDNPHIPAYEWQPPPSILVAHADYGESKCPGLIQPEIKGQEADLVCNDCGAVIRTVPAAEADKVLDEMASTEICSAVCPVCREFNMFPGFSLMLAYVCVHCGAGVEGEGDKIQ